MIKISFIKKNKEKMIEGVKKRYLFVLKEILSLIKKILYLLDDKRKIQVKINTCIFLLKNCRKSKFKNKIYNKLNIENKFSYENTLLSSIRRQLLHKLFKLPNIPYFYVNKGFSLFSNDIIFQYKQNSFYNKKLHWDLFKSTGLINYKLGTKISGYGFIVTKGKVSKLFRSMIDYFLDYNLYKKYTEYTVPYLVKSPTAVYTGQLPDKEGQMYYISQDNLYLIPTGEVSLINCYNNILLKKDKLPIRVTTYTKCFRREAGSYGTSVRGLNRLHQFDKVEIIQITNSSDSILSLQMMIHHVKKLLISLNLPFRLLRLCGGELGFTSAITYDFEVFSFAQKKWIEVSSISNCTNYQSNKLKIHYNNTNVKKTNICHTLNGSSIAIERILSILLENHQKGDLIKIPNTLIPYTGFKEIFFY